MKDDKNINSVKYFSEDRNYDKWVIIARTFSSNFIRFKFL